MIRIINFVGLLFIFFITDVVIPYRRGDLRDRVRLACGALTVAVWGIFWWFFVLEGSEAGAGNTSLALGFLLGFLYSGIHRALRAAPAAKKRKGS